MENSIYLYMIVNIFYIIKYIQDIFKVLYDNKDMIVKGNFDNLF